MKNIVFIALTTAALVACGDKQQTSSTPKNDAAPYAGTGVAAFTVAGWKAGDKAGWEQQLKARMQNTQNEYSKVN